MKKHVIISVLTSLVIYSNVGAQSSAVLNIMSSLNSSDYKMVDSEIKSLGIEKGTSGGFKKCQMLQPSLPESNNMYVLALSWDPPDGYILLVDESGKVISKFKTGYIISLTLQERDDMESADLVITNGIVSYGSGGYQKDVFRLFSINKKGLNVVWEGVSYLDDLYEEGKKIYGAITFESNPDHGAYKLRYNSIIEKYAFDKKMNKFALLKKEAKSDLIEISQ